MADWVDIPESSIEPNAPARSPTVRAFRDNPIALAEGAAGAPRLQTAAIEGGAVTTAKIANSAVNAGKLANDSGTRDWVLARTASASVGVVGTYALLFHTLLSEVRRGETVAGGDLVYSSAGGTTNSPTPDQPSGSWRCMGYADATGVGNDENKTTLWLRIA